METALGKSIREKETGTKVSSVVERNLVKILTRGTLTFSEMLTDDMSSYCMSIQVFF